MAEGHSLTEGPAPNSKAVDSIPSALSYQEHADPWVLGDCHSPPVGDWGHEALCIHSGGVAINHSSYLNTD